MHKQYALPITLGIGTGILLLLTLILIYKLSHGRHKKKGTSKKPRSINPTPSIKHPDIPDFTLPNWRRVAVQEPIRESRHDYTSSDEYDLDAIAPRNNNNMPFSTVLKTSQSVPDITPKRTSKMEPVSPLKKKKISRLSGSISLQDLNTYSPSLRIRSVIDEEVIPSIKFALYYSVGTNELNVTVMSVNNLRQLAKLSEVPSLCVWVQVEFSRYHQEFRTKSSSLMNADESVFNETCVVSDFPVEHFNGTKISFRVIDNATVVAEAVHVVAGLPPSFPRNETTELQHPGIVQSSQLAKSGEILVRLRYDPVDETVTLGIVECRGLKSSSKKKKPLDTYVKVHVIFCDQVVQRFKSKLVHKSNNPSFEENFQLAGFFSRGKMNQILVKLTVFARSVTKIGLGYVILGTGRQNDITASGYQHWETIIDKPQLDIAQWHPLKPVRSMTP